MNNLIRIKLKNAKQMFISMGLLGSGLRGNERRKKQILDEHSKLLPFALAAGNSRISFAGILITTL